MGSSLSSAVTTDRLLSDRSIGSSTSFNNTTLLPISQQPLSLPGPAEPAGPVNTSTGASATTPIDIQLFDCTTDMNQSANAPMEIDFVHLLTSTGESTTSPVVNPHTGDNPSQDESKLTAELTLPLSVAALSLTLLVNAPKPVKPNLFFPYNACLVSLCLSHFTSIGLCMFSLVKSAQSEDFAWYRMRLMIIAFRSLLISVILRLSLMLSTTNMGYDRLSFLAISSGIFLYLGYNRRKVNKLRQTASSEISIFAILFSPNN